MLMHRDDDGFVNMPLGHINKAKLSVTGGRWHFTNGCKTTMANDAIAVLRDSKKESNLFYTVYPPRRK